MTGTEIAMIIGVLSALGVAVLAIRRAAMRNQLPRADRPGQLRAASEEEEEEQSDLAAEEADRELPEEAEEDEFQEDEEPGEEEEEEEASAEDEAERLRAGLVKTRESGFVGRLGRLFRKKQIDADVLDELEEVLFTADIGPKTAARLFEAIKGSLSKAELEDPDTIWARLREESNKILNVDSEEVAFESASPFVLLVLGVNGVGKTTTIGKIAAKWTREGKKVLLAAGDTFRAAAVEQLERWGERANVPVVRGKEGGDPSSVIFDAVKRGQEEGFDIVIADTAGRLHTKTNLMEEREKVGRVIDKALPGAPHETWLVLDSTTGQNAIQQAQTFKAAMDVTGIVLTKLDGTAKGGVILGICEELGVPVRFIGVGEQVDDLRPFDAEAFVEALYTESDAADAA